MRRGWIRLGWVIVGWGLMLIAAQGGSRVRAEQIELQSPELNESSGLAQVGEFWWTHNDSGDVPRLFVFDRQGQLRGQYEVTGAQAEDWEDICGLTRGDRHYLAIGDVGDNLAQRPAVQIYVVEVPAELPQSESPSAPGGKLPVVACIQVSYPDGPVNCEALAYDPRTEAFVLATKEAVRCRLFSVPVGRLEGQQQVGARPLGGLVLPWVTGGDIDAAGSRLALTTYGPACLIRCDADAREPDRWLADLQGSMTLLPLPARRQGESICFSRDGSQLALTSEFAPTPLWTVPLPPGFDGQIGR